MRVDSGKFKGKRLETNKFDHIRPTTDKVRQAIFVKLQFFVQGKSVLDLFAGTGALGIEAISKGAGSVLFVDKDARSVDMVKKNLKNLGLVEKVYKSDALVFLKGCKQKFDLILIDPPYKSNLYHDLLKMIFEKKILSDDGIIVCEHGSDEKIIQDDFNLFDTKRYGNISLSYFEYKE